MAHLVHSAGGHLIHETGGHLVHSNYIAVAPAWPPRYKTANFRSWSEVMTYFNTSTVPWNTYTYSPGVYVELWLLYYGRWVPDAFVQRYDTSAYNGATIDAISFDVSIDSMAAPHTASLYLDASASSSPGVDTSIWDRQVPVPAGTGVKTETLSSSLVLDDWLHVCPLWDPWATSWHTWAGSGAYPANLKWRCGTTLQLRIV